MTTECDVIVVGYGPTGQAATSLLARLGHRVVAFERWPNLYGLPRAVGVDSEAFRMIQAAGNVEVALREACVIRRYLFKNAKGDVLLDIAWEGMGVSGFPDHISMYQPNVEEAMATAARERGATVYQGWEVLTCEQDSDGVTVTATAENGRQLEVRGRWVIAADGASSRLRELLNIEREELGLRNTFLSIDVIKRSDLPPSDTYLFDGAIVVCGPPRFHLSAPIGESRLRFEFEVLAGEEPSDQLRPEAAWTHLRAVHGLGPEDVEIYRQVIYEFESKLAKRWREGRVFLAGDAAHQMSPFLAQGMVSGLRDSINLAWRLDLVLRGVAPERLLDGYEAERSPHAREYVIQSSALGKVAIEPDPEAAAARDEVFLTGGAGDPPPPVILTTGVLYRGADGELDELAGQLGPQGRVTFFGRTGRADDVVGWGFALLCRGTSLATELRPGDKRLLELINGRVFLLDHESREGIAHDIDGTYTRFFDEHDVRAVLVRPDFVIFGAARRSGDIPRLLDSLRHQLGVSSIDNDPALEGNVVSE